MHIHVSSSNMSEKLSTVHGGRLILTATCAGVTLAHWEVFPSEEHLLPVIINMEYLLNRTHNDLGQKPRLWVSL